MTDRTTAYYNQTAAEYDQMHGGDENYEHVRALERAWPLLSSRPLASALDVGCGTGRSLAWLQDRGVQDLIGIDPSEGLLKVARDRIPQARLKVGRGESLSFGDGSVDVVLATGIMHHVDRPADVIGEMFRVARVAVLISDHNNFAFGGRRARATRLWLHATGLLGLATYIKQGFRRQGYSDGDGWWYPYSLLSHYGLIASLSATQYIIPTRPATAQDNLLVSQSHLAILAFKQNGAGDGHGGSASS